MTPHKHAALIKAWADGAQIERKQQCGTWMIVAGPSWREEFEFRIKPEPKKDSVWYFQADFDRRRNFGAGSLVRYDGDNLRLTFDGETGALKAAEVIGGKNERAD